MNYAELEFAEGQSNLGGLRPIGYYGFVADTAVIPEVPTVLTASATLDAVSVIAGNIVMKAGKYMYPMYGTLEKLNLKGEGQGERDGHSTKVSATWFIPGHTSQNLGAARHVPKRRMFFIFIDHEAHKRLVGNSYFPAEVKASDDTGTAVSDLKGVTYEISTYSDGPAPIYTGEVPTADGSAGI